MKAFEDARGRTWVLAVNVVTCRRVKARLDIHLPGLAEDRAKGLVELLGDALRLVDVLYVLCQDQAEKAGVTDEQFGEAMAGDALAAAADAFVEAWTDFFHGPQQELRKPTATKRLLAVHLPSMWNGLSLAVAESSDSIPALARAP